MLAPEAFDRIADQLNEQDFYRRDHQLIFRAIRELAEKVVEMTGSKSVISYEPLPCDDPKQRKPDISLAREKLGWEPKVALEEGLVKTIAYFERQLKDGLA